MNADGPDLSLCFARLADVVIAFDATLIDHFVDGAEQPERPDVDVAAALDIELETGELNRRVAILSTERGALSVALGDHLQLGSIADAQVRPLPRFVQGAEGRCALNGFVRHQGGFAFLVDVQRLARQGPMPDPKGS